MNDIGLRLSGALFCEPDELTPAQRIDEIVALERQLGFVQARQCRVLALMARQARGVAAEKEWVREDVRAALAESAVGAGIRLEVAEALVTRFPATLDALGGGVVTYRQARCLSEQCTDLDDLAARRVEAEVLDALRDDSADRSLTAFRRRVRRAVLAADPSSAQRRQQQAVDDRRVGFEPGADGAATIWGSLPADDAVLVDRALDRLADAGARDPSDPRTHSQRRADALVVMAVDSLAGRCRHCADAPTGAVRPPQPARPVIRVTVAMSTLLGLDESPADLDGFGPVHADVARRIAADPSGTWRRLVTDELGRLLDYGRTTYTPPADLDRFARVRDVECIFPTCHRRAESCELDHTKAWGAGGSTCPANVKPCCSRHHHLKHEAGWSLRREADGTMVWTSPTGHRYPVKPTRHPIDRTMQRIDDLDAGSDPPGPAATG